MAEHIMAQTTLRMVITRWTGRAGWAAMIALAPRLELEQAFLRLIIGTLVLVVLALRLVGQSTADTNLLHMTWFLAGFVTIAVAIILWMLARPQDAPARKVLGIIADNGAITYFMLQLGESGATIFAIYLFVAFGNAFRFGPRYLRISHGIALLGFAIVIFTSDFWSRHIAIAYGLFLALLVLPLYVGTLIQRLQAEHLKAEQALKECREALKECREREQRGVLIAPGFSTRDAGQNHAEGSDDARARPCA
jgi:two-component system, sensor histidine kinase RpfC